MNEQNCDLVPIEAKSIGIKNNNNKVVIHNNIYKIDLGKLNSKENDLLFAIFSFLKDKGNTVIKFTLKDLKILINEHKINHQELEKLVISLWEKLRMVNFWVIGKGFKKNVMLFDHFKLNYSDESNKQFLSIEIQINNENFGYLFNELFKNFTKFDLKQFQNIKSKYAKNIFRLLKRYEDVSFSDHRGNVANKHGHTLLTYKYDIEGFKNFIGVPNLRFSQIENQILIPACQELSNYVYCDKESPIKQTKQLSNHEKPYRSIVIMKNHFDKNNNRSKGNKVIGIELQYSTKDSETTKTKALNRVQQVKFVLSQSVKESNFYTPEEINDLNEVFLNKKVIISKNNTKTKAQILFIKTTDTSWISFICDVLDKNNQWIRKGFEFNSLENLFNSVVVLDEKDPNHPKDLVEEFCQSDLLNKEVKITVGNKIPKVKLATILDIKFQKSGKVKLDLIWHGQKEKKTINYHDKAALINSIVEF
ncbi:initiator RepB protein [Helicobacter pylori GAM96Ai]|uniref:replication initiation protein n=1 Tax=Helicobacter pylori TaxID=210 RepID=UPI0002BAEB1F|nr:replication initiation protein [Helicobacter pylori]EMH44289.1 initiator RepB protein [Helicobacter pylori GAM96Ai]